MDPNEFTMIYLLNDVNGLIMFDTIPPAPLVIYIIELTHRSHPAIVESEDVKVSPCPSASAAKKPSGGIGLVHFDHFEPPQNVAHTGTTCGFHWLSPWLSHSKVPK